LAGGFVAGLAGGVCGAWAAMEAVSEISSRLKITGLAFMVSLSGFPVK
jgi:Ca2+/Na+ antiporter